MLLSEIPQNQHSVGQTHTWTTLLVLAAVQYLHATVGVGRARQARPDRAGPAVDSTGAGPEVEQRESSVCGRI